MNGFKQRDAMALKYGLIGCGRISPNHIAAALDNRLQITAVCDIVPQRMKNIIAAFSLPDTVHAFTDYRDMLRSEKPELVAVATESGKHARIALDCIEQGCHVIIEKPIALSLHDADAVIAAAKSRNVKVCACHQNRFNSSVQKLRQAVEASRFGRLLHGAAHIRWNRGEDYYRQAVWRGTWAQDGGALMNQCIHNIDLLRWMMGGGITDVTGLTDRLLHGYIQAEDLGLALVRFAGGSYGLIEGTTNVFPSNLEETLYIFGEKGTAKIGGKSVNIIEEWRFEDGLDDSESVKASCSENPPNVYGFGHRPLYTDMISAIMTDREPYVTAADGRDALELVLAIYKSAATGHSVKLPMDRCSSADFSGRFC